MTQAYPLQWPIGWPRTKPQDRQNGRFGKARKTDYGWRSRQEITLYQAVTRVLEELQRLGAMQDEDIIISTNLQVRLDGLPKAGQRKPVDPGVAVYFTRFDSRGKQSVIPCDAYDSVEQNIAAVAATIAALRALERYGTGIMERAFTGFEALPHLVERDWWEVLGVDEDAPWLLIKARAHSLQSQHHPDHGGDASQFDVVRKAFERAREVRGA